MMRSDMRNQINRPGGPRSAMPVMPGGSVTPRVPGPGGMGTGVGGGPVQSQPAPAVARAFRKGGMATKGKSSSVSTKGHGCCSGGKKPCKIC